MSTAKKTVSAAIEAGTNALIKAKELPQRVITLPNTLKSSTTIDLRQLPKQIQSSIRVPARATDLVEEAKKISDKATARVHKAAEDILARGKSLPKIEIKVRSSKPKPKAKATVAKAKTAKPKVSKPKAAAKPKVTAPVASVEPVAPVAPAVETPAEPII